MISPLKKLKEILIEKKSIDPVIFDQAEAVGEFFVDYIIKKGLASESEVVDFFVEGLGAISVDVSDLKIFPDVLSIIPKAIVLNYQVMPIARIGHVLVLAMANSSDIVSIDNINALTGFKVRPVESQLEDIEKAIGIYYSEDANIAFDQIIKDISDSEELELVKDSSKITEKQHVENLTQDAPTIRLTDAIIKQAITAKASDIFIEPLEKALRIRYRVDGIIREVERMSKNLHFPVISRIKIMSNLDISEHRLPQDGRFKIMTDRKQEVDFRVSVLPAAFGEKVVLRVLDKNAAMLDITKLGLKGQALETLKECSLKPHGMILTCGPTGSGKTTTLYSILKFIDSPEKNIITVEDPVEYQMKGINQVNIKPQVNLTFASTLRSILRQDPDVIMIGEIRDFETLDVAIKAALTGHLVLSSLHTTTAAGSIVRMMNMGIEPFLICSSVLSVVAQRLLRKLCDKCKEPYDVPDCVAEKIGLTKLKFDEKPTFFKAKGCKHCFELGYRGRVGITEIMVLTPAVKKCILERSGEYRIKEVSRQENMVTMREDALEKAAVGLTSIEEVLRVTALDEEMKE
ncbi:MAG: ATPase, T2SS/T4P/T4SS family [Candidatus Omnitrophica bacterium]|nr:ATPase, T2SS/T4P/T4SS family [Candidatus Omnitrophota bacterium]